MEKLKVNKLQPGDTIGFLIASSANKTDRFQKIEEEINKVKVRPIMLKDTLVYQATETVGAQVFHQNYDKNELISKIENYMESSFRQMEATCTQMQATVLVSKKGKVTIKKKNIKINISLWLWIHMHN